MFVNMITCAATAYMVTLPDGSVREVILPDSCHGGRNMRETVQLLKELGCEVRMNKERKDRGQGFTDESGNFHDRSTSYEIAKSSNQPFNDEYTLPNNKLDSSCIRHFRIEDE